MRSYPGKSSCSGSECFRKEPSNGPEWGETLNGKGAEDDRSACSTEDSGPKKHGNPALGGRGENPDDSGKDGGTIQGRHWVVGRRRREVGVTTRESRDSVEGERASKPNGEREGSTDTKGKSRRSGAIRSEP